MSTWPPRFRSVAFQAGPPTPEGLLVSARSAYRAGQYPMAEELCRRVLLIDAERIPAKALLGLIAGRTGRADLGIHLLREAIAMNPASWETLNALAILLRHKGDLDEAIEVRRRAIELQPHDPQGYNELAHCYMGKGEFESAVEALREASRLAPSNVLFLYNLGTALAELFRNAEAEKVFRQALSIDPDDARSLAGLGELLTRLGRRREAVECYHRAHATHPPSAEGNLYIARQLIEAQEIPEAVELLEAASVMEPDSIRVQVTTGEMMIKVGRFEEAISHLARAMELDPESIAAYTFYCDGKKITAEDRPVIDRLERIAAKTDLSVDSQLLVHFSLGKAFNDLQEYETAIRHYDEAARVGEGALESKRGPFPGEAHQQRFGQIVETYDERFLRELKGHGSDSDAPILIVGMIRSGTTLTEQILSSHPQVGGGGEVPFWYDLVHRTLKSSDPRQPDQVIEWSARYLDILRELSPNTPRVTDKNPANFVSLGLIHACMPNARIIHCRRHPVDNCLSMYMTRNAIPYTFDRANIVFTYRQYLRLMDHWRGVLPSDRFIEVRYEDLVADPEGQIRKLVEFCGLEWDDACLRHPSNDRRIQTPSLWQARQPIYKTSVERWRNYEPWLGEFRELMEVEY